MKIQVLDRFNPDGDLILLVHLYNELARKVHAVIPDWKTFVTRYGTHESLFAVVTGRLVYNYWSKSPVIGISASDVSFVLPETAYHDDAEDPYRNVIDSEL